MELSKSIPDKLFNAIVPVIIGFLNVGYDNFGWEQLAKAIAHKMGRTSAQDLICANAAGKRIRDNFPKRYALMKFRESSWTQGDFKIMIRCVTDAMDDSETILAMQADREARKAREGLSIASTDPQHSFKAENFIIKESGGK